MAPFGKAGYLYARSLLYDQSLMREETDEQQRPLRFGYTTGACATATSLAAARLLLAGEASSSSTIDLPRGQRVEFQLQYCKTTAEGAQAGVIKDAGDDPDVTHGALISAQVQLEPTPGVRFHAGQGIGTVTRDGLAIAVGEAAINPIPRRMISEHLKDLAAERNYCGGFAVTIHCKDGDKLALKTMNPRLGILGGISILGTTGIVRPFSCSAYIASIHQAIDVARANGHQQIAACTGSTSEQSIQSLLGLEEMALIEMGDFAGAVLKYINKAPVKRLVIAAGFGKLSKLACGHIDLHSRASQVDFKYLGNTAGKLGAPPELVSTIEQANTSLAALKLATDQDIALADQVCLDARAVCRRYLPEDTEVAIYAFDKAGKQVGVAR